MPMLLYDFTDVIAFGADHSTVAETVARAARQMGIAVSPDPMPEQAIFVRSDHYEFVKPRRAGDPAGHRLSPMAARRIGRPILGEPLSPVNDDMRQAINWEAGARYARLNYLIARRAGRRRRRARSGIGAIISATSSRRGRPRAEGRPLD